MQGDRCTYDGLELCKLGPEVRRSEGDERSFVAHLIAVVGRGENSNALAVVLDFVAVGLRCE